MLDSDLTLRRDSLVVFRDGSFTGGTHYFVKRFGPTSGGSCFDIQTSALAHCEYVQRLRFAARERLEISDLIIRGDLIPALTKRKTTSQAKGPKLP